MSRRNEVANQQSPGFAVKARLPSRARPPWKTSKPLPIGTIGAATQCIQCPQHVQVGSSWQNPALPVRNRCGDLRMLEPEASVSIPSETRQEKQEAGSLGWRNDKQRQGVDEIVLRFSKLDRMTPMADRAWHFM